MNEHNEINGGNFSSVASFWGYVCGAFSHGRQALGTAGDNLLSIMGLDFSLDMSELDLAIGPVGTDAAHEVKIQNGNNAVTVAVIPTISENPSHVIASFTMKDGWQQSFVIDMRIPREIESSLAEFSKIIAGMTSLEKVSIGLVDAKQVANLIQEGQSNALTTADDDRAATVDEVASTVKALLPVIGQQILVILEQPVALQGQSMPAQSSRIPSHQMTNDKLRKVFQTVYEAMSKILKKANSNTTLGDLREEMTKLKIESQLDEALVGTSQQNKEPLVEALRGLETTYNAIFNRGRQSNKSIRQAECERYMSMINEANELLTSSPPQVNDDATELDDAAQSPASKRTVKVEVADAKKTDKKLASVHRHAQGVRDQKEKNAVKRALNKNSHRGDSTSLSSHDGTVSSSPTSPNTPTTISPSLPTTTHGSLDDNTQGNPPADMAADKLQPAQEDSSTSAPVSPKTTSKKRPEKYELLKIFQEVYKIMSGAFKQISNTVGFSTPIVSTGLNEAMVGIDSKLKTALSGYELKQNEESLVAALRELKRVDTNIRRKPRLTKEEYNEYVDIITKANEAVRKEMSSTEGLQVMMEGERQDIIGEESKGSDKLMQTIQQNIDEIKNKKGREDALKKMESLHENSSKKIIDEWRGEFDRLAKEQALPKKQKTVDASSNVDKNDSKRPSARAVGDSDSDNDNDNDNDNDTSTTRTTYCPADPKPDIDSANISNPVSRRENKPDNQTPPSAAVKTDNQVDFDDNEVQSTKVEDNHKLTQVELDEKILVVMKAAVAAAKKSYGRSWTGTTKEEDLQKLINAYANKINGAVELRSEQDILKEFIQKASEPRKVMGLFDMGKAELGDTASAKAFYRALDDESLRKRFTDMLGLAELAAPDGKNQQEFITKVVNKVSPPSAPTQGLTGPGSSSGS